MAKKLRRAAKAAEYERLTRQARKERKMSTRCPACGEFIGDNTFGKHNCGKVIEWNAVELASTDPRDAQIAALTERLRAVEAARDEWKRKYETQCAGSMSAHERRIHLEAELSALRAELERKDATLKVAGLALRHCEGELSAISHRGTVDTNNVKNFSAEARAAIRWVEEALQPKEPPCQTA